MEPAQIDRRFTQQPSMLPIFLAFKVPVEK